MQILEAPGPAAGLAVFLDLDGTLVEIAEHPELVDVPASLVRSLAAAHARLDGALALISGRSIASLDRLLAPLELPAAGEHGLEFREASGRRHRSIPLRLSDAARGRLEAFAARRDDLYAEHKGETVAIHYRANPALADDVEALVGSVRDELAPGFVIQRGKMVRELRPAGADKGTAIRHFMAGPPFAGRRPVFIGDDVTDEDGFRFINSIGGISVRVGRPEDATAATRWLPDVAAVRAWLAAMPDAHRERRA